MFVKKITKILISKSIFYVKNGLPCKKSSVSIVNVFKINESKVNIYRKGNGSKSISPNGSVSKVNVSKGNEVPKKSFSSKLNFFIYKNDRKQV